MNNKGTAIIVNIQSTLYGGVNDFVHFTVLVLDKKGVRGCRGDFLHVT